MAGNFDDPNQNFDSGANWDGNDLSTYLDLITSEHADKPDFIAMVTMSAQPQVDIQTCVGGMLGLFDVDYALGQQLDFVGEWVGVTRFLSIPLTGVYFSLDTVGLGFDEGTWLGPFDPIDGLVELADEQYRILIRARIANNQWDGTIPGAYKFMEPVFPGNTFFIQDNGDMTMYIGVVGAMPLDAVSYALLTEGYLDVKPVGVRIAGYVSPSIPGVPLFGFDVENSTISGLDVGSWSIITGGN